MLSSRDILKTNRKKHAREWRKFYGIIGGASILLFIFLFVCAGFLSGWSAIVIRDITVEGNSVAHTEDIVRSAQMELVGKYFFVFHRDNIFLFPKPKIRERLLDEFKRISLVDIQRESLTSIRIIIAEHIPAYVWCGESEGNVGVPSSCYFADENGYVFAEAPYFSGNVFFELFGSLTGVGDEAAGKRYLDELMFKKIMLFKDAISWNGWRAVRLMKMDDEGGYAFVLDSGTKIIFNKDQEFAVLADNFNSVLGTLPLNEPIEYIDLRFGNKVFYRAVNTN